jgi:serine/threonine protein kinase/tetratricopeptide (TPR) repeat protein
VEPAVTSAERPPLPVLRERPEQLGRYVVRREIGAGGMGKVFAAYDPRLDREVALKVLHRSDDAGEWAAALIHEARALARLAHPNVIAVYDVGLVGGDVFIAMELVEGVTLKAWRSDARPWRDVVRLYLQAGRGLAAAHAEGLIHRDFKPENCLFGNDGRVRVLDFGLARRTERARPAPDESSDTFRNLLSTKKDVPFDSDLAGTPRYMAPEQFRNEGISEKVDQFSFAIALWEALLGTHPFPFETVFQFLFAVTDGKPPLVPDGAGVPDWILDPLRVALRAKPEDRHPSMGTLLAALEDGISASRPKASRLGWRYERAEGGVRDRCTGRVSVAERCDDPDDRALQRLAILRHPNLARVLDVAIDGGIHLVLDVPQGTETIDGLEDKPESIVRPILEQVLRGIDHLHRSGLVHGRLGGEHVRILSGHVILTGLSGAKAGDPGVDLSAFLAITERLTGARAEGSFSSATDIARRMRFELDTPEAREGLLQGAPLVGRSSELAELETAIDDAFRGRGSVTLIAGESGSGKSRLLQELGAVARRRGAVVLAGQAVADRAPSFTPWREPIVCLALATPLLDEEAAAFRLAVPEIDRILDREVEVPPELPASAMQARLQGAMLSVIGRLGQPVVILLEDLHWARAESVALLEGLSHFGLDRSMAVVASYRNDEGVAFPFGRTLVLGRLDAAATTAWAGALAGPKAAELIARETEGNPFFVVEAIRALAEEAGGLDCVGALEALPKDMGGGARRVIQKRLARIDAADRPLLELAALAGRDVDEALLASLDRGDVAAWLERTVRAGVLERREGRGRFSHDKIREAVVDAIDADRARPMHVEVARALEALYGERAAPALSHHYALAKDEANEGRFSRIAGTQALRASAAEAWPYLVRAAELEREPLPLARLHRQLGEAAYELADFDGTEAHLSKALALLDRSPPSSAIGWTLMAVGQLAVQAWHRIARIAVEDDERTREASRAAGRLAKLWAHRPNPVRLLSLALLAVNLAERSGTRNVYALGMLGYAAGMLGFAKLPGIYFGEAHGTDDPASVEARVMEAIYLGSTGQKARALSAIEEGLAIARRNGDRFGIASIEAVRAHVMWFFGRIGEMSPAYERAVRAVDSSEIGHRATFRLGRALGHYLDGHVEEARALADDALDRISELDHSIRASGLAIRSLVALELGDVGGAVRSVDEAMALLPHGSLVAPIFFHVPMACFEVSLAAKRLDRLESTLAFERAWARNAPLGRPQLDLHEGKAARARGDEGAAVFALERGRARAKILGAPIYEGLCAAELGDADAARASFEETGAGLFLRKVQSR